MEEKWGPWIDHDGKGCPCVGEWVQCVFDDGTLSEGTAGEYAAIAVAGGFDPFVSWKWALVPVVSPKGYWAGRIIRYRVRKPRGMTVLENLIADLPEKVTT